MRFSVQTGNVDRLVYCFYVVKGKGRVESEEPLNQCLDSFYNFDI